MTGSGVHAANCALGHRCRSPEFRFPFLGVELDVSKNASSPVDADVASAGSAVRVLVVHTDEDWEIVRECARLLG